MQTKYSKKFKIEAIKKALSRSSDTTLTSIAHSLDLKMSTLCGWIKNMSNKEDSAPLSREGVDKKSPYNWTAKEKLDALLESNNLSQEEISEYCRKKGIFPHHLERWKAEFINSSDKQKVGRSTEIGDLKNQVKSLNTELRRKEKALAEAAALLVLKKKIHDLWDSDEGS
jgi:transposase